MGEFTTVAKVSDLESGQSKTVEVNGQAIALFKIGDEFYATQNDCLHRQGPLGEGYLEGGVVTCPWHGWQFDVKTGKAQMGPGSLKTYSVKVEGEDVKVAL
ncbi:MAG TPA: non-heme iron oxygenase ferredoxin subunit [Bdellovibrionota bacterium]|nr:non-heme iron oxygenase ferredoxin subunit [Bdellovibrionota bacterium]